MKQPVPRREKKSKEKPVVIRTNTKITPKISERTLRLRREAKERRLNPGKFASGLNLCGIIILYIFLILAVLIGIGGIVVCAIYFNVSSTTQGWKIAGIAMGAVTIIAGAILISLTIFKQARNRPWQYKKKNVSPADGVDLIDDDDGDSLDKSFDGDEISGENDLEKTNRVALSAPVRSSATSHKREIALSPIGDLKADSVHRQNVNDNIFCPGCNRVHPSAHQCMYSTRVANGFANSMPVATKPLAQDSIAIQTEDEVVKKKKKTPHTVIDRTLKYSNTTETQTNVTAKPGPNIAESIIVRRVPIPTAKVVVQQPTTKVMIVKVPNTPGQLVIQPKAGKTTDEQKN